MPRIKAFGRTFNAKLIADMGNGVYRMEATEHTARTAPGTIITVNKTEVVDWGETGSASENGLAAVDKAMAEERKTLPPVTTLLKGAEKIPGRPTERP